MGSDTSFYPGGDGGELLAVLVAPIVYEVLGQLAPGCGITQLLGRPLVGGEAVMAV